MKNASFVKQAAIKLRKRGRSYGEISKELGGVSKSTLSYWLKDVPLTPKMRQKFYNTKIRNLALGTPSAKQRRLDQINEIIEAAKQEFTQPISMETYKLFGAALYWAEGTKRGMFELTNSDPLLIFFMVQWLETSFEIDSKRLGARLNIYPQQNEDDLKRFWSDLCGIPIVNFGKTYVKPKSFDYKRNNLYYGTIKITVPKSSDMKHRMFGWIEALLEPHQGKVSHIERKWQRLKTIERPINLL